MIILRHLIVYSLVLVLLPWGAWAHAAASSHGQLKSAPEIAASQTAVSAVDTDQRNIVTKPKRCRIAVLAGISCVADSVWHRPAAFDPSTQVQRNPYFAKVTLPRGVSTSVHLDPPRRG